MREAKAPGRAVTWMTGFLDLSNCPVERHLTLAADKVS
jgi:hypothetical protein